MQNSRPPCHAIKVIIIFLPSLFVYSSYNSQRIWYRTTNSYASHLLCLFVMQCFLPIAEIPRKFKQMQQQNTKGLTLLQGEKQNTQRMISNHQLPTMMRLVTLQTEQCSVVLWSYSHQARPRKDLASQMMTKKSRTDCQQIG